MSRPFGLLGLIALALFCSACATDLARHPFFSQYIARPLTLQRPMDLMELAAAKGNEDGLPLYVDPSGTPTDKILSPERLNKDSQPLKSDWGMKYLTPLSTVTGRRFTLWEQGRANMSMCYVDNICGAQVNIRHLQKGDMITIDMIVHTGIDSAAVEARGRVYVRELSREVEFTYVWGTSNRIGRAPWESEDVPLERDVDL